MASRAVALWLALAALAPCAAAASTSDALNSVLAYDPARYETLSRLNEAMAAPGEIHVRGLREQLRSANPYRRWAATYIAHAVADDPPDLRALRPRLRDESASVRALAAFGLAGNGSKRGLRELVELAGSDEYMIQSDLEPLAGLAEERLKVLTRARVNGARAWARWWADVRRNIRWDRGAERFRWRRDGRSRERGRSSTRPPFIAGPAGGDAVRVPIKVQVLWGPGATSAQKRAVLRNLRRAVDLLNGDGRTGRCKPIEFELDLVVGGDLLSDHYSILVNEIPTANKARWSTSWINHEDKTGRLWTARAADPSGVEMIAHEFGHIAGLPDEYFEYVTEGGQTRTSPVDPTSIMGSHEGSLLQRHLDYLSRLHDPDGGAGCERWELRFPAWTSRLDAFTEESGGTTTNWLGLTAVATIEAGFWVDLDGGVRPGGYSPCGTEVVPGRTPHNPGGRNTRCPEAGGNSAGVFAGADEGGADCARPGPRLAFEPERFETVVSGGREGETFSLELRVGDSELAEAVRCEPAVEPSITKRYRLIRDGMRYAGALDFDISPPSRDFRREGDHKSAYGQALLARIDP